MKEKVLFVDDDPNILEAYTRNLRKFYEIDTALKGDEGLAKLNNKEPYLVVVSDLRMPGMNGVGFLSNVKEKAPDTIRMMLTGNADLEAAIESVNRGNIFRFLVKPCSVDILKGALDDGIRQYNLVNAERELLEKTLLGSVKMLTEVLSLVNPVAFSRASRVKTLVSQLVKHLNLSNGWKYEIAAMLSQVGCVTIPPAVLEKVYLEQPLNEDEKQMLKNHPLVARGIIENIPRLEDIAEIIANQNVESNEKHSITDSFPENEISLGVKLLKIALDFDALESGGLIKKAAIAHLEQQSECYDPKILATLKLAVGAKSNYKLTSVTLNELLPGMILVEDLRNLEGLLLVAKGQEISETSRQRLRNYATTVGLLGGKIKVHVPS